MRDYIKRFLIAGIMAFFISLLFLGGKSIQAQTVNIEEVTAHWIWPSDGVITDGFGTRQGNHKGIDIAAEFKSPIYSVDNGVVTKSYYSYSYGHVIFISHENGFETVYAHLNKRLVTEGQPVKQGEKIGQMGNTGDSSGVHLHFEVHQNKWTYGKENAFDPAVALGEAEVGQSVYAASAGRDSRSTMEAAAGLKSQDPNIYEPTDNKTEQKSVDGIIHTVSPGETLWSISQKYDSTVEVIKSENDVKGSQIIPGQQLFVKKNDSKQYIVSAGDTLVHIAAKTNTSVKELKALNELKSDRIHPQQILKISQN
ncbi:M23 family metallopeptidase [Mesobacillus harenae]|uniref:M23 family metallopeptidase n=1 Tax=Mesobacillus harenae TaxID=2213203 RepID=UPI0015805B92|nr:M23 family metallopeptidase [Mesobacillus harenae]